MQAGHGRLTSLCWAGLVWGAILTGCATPSPQWSPGMSRHRSQVFRAASDLPPGDGAPSSPGIQGYTVPGRNPNSQAPFEFFLGTLRTG